MITTLLLTLALPQAGSLINTITGGDVNGNFGLARNGAIIAVTSNNDGANVLYLVDEATGASAGLVSVNSDNYAGLGYDSSRDLYICTDATSGAIDMYSPAGVLVRSFTGPQHPNGAAYDSLRDVYWITDWMAAGLNAIDPNTGLVVQTIDLSPWISTSLATDNLADCGYHSGADALVIGLRQVIGNKILIIDVSSSSVSSSFNAQGTGGFNSNNPPGIAVSSSGDIWHSQSSDNLLYEVESGLGGLGNPITLAITGSAPGSVTFDVTGLTPAGIAVFVYGPAGSFTVQNGPCAGLLLEIAAPTIGPMFSGDVNGDYSTTMSLPAGAVGVTVQAVDVPTCMASPAAVIQ